MAKKKYVSTQTTSEDQDSSPCRHFLGASKKEIKILQELAHILEDLPQGIQEESVLSHVRSYVIVRDSFLSSVRLCSYDIKINRELLSHPERKQFNSILALALEYLTDANQQIFSKKEFQTHFEFGEAGYKLYSAMINTLQRHDVQQCLNKQFTIHAKAGEHTLSSALEGTRLFLKKKASFVREEIIRFSSRYQQELLEAFAA